ncbi:hypothetical protein QVD17_36218 [Tagetes erecta]|uniref:Uncharacterized protein n=1 Tax=Tagetes erecta TaxID=13708 RepID=A0AAD8JS10_TARER|nr:hypothetical protein QVD17_36218 [Tagetes erecta]
MSRHVSNGGCRQAIEAAPPRLIRLERRPTMEKKLPTIKEDECSGGDQGSLGNRPAAFSSCSTKSLYSMKHSACN